MNPNEVDQKKSVASTFLLLIGVAVVVGGLFVIDHAIGIDGAMSAFGSLFLLYWAGIQHQSRVEFLPSAIGGMFGVTLAWLLMSGEHFFGSGWGIEGPFVIAFVLFFYLRGQAHMFVNNGSMLFLLVSTIPELHVAANAMLMLLSLAVGAAWIGIVSYVAAQTRRYWRRASA